MAVESGFDIQDVMRTIRQRAEARRQTGESVAPTLSRARFQENVIDGKQLASLVQLGGKVAAVKLAQTEVGTINPRRPGLHNSMIQAIKRGMLRSLSWYTRPLVRLHSSIVDSLIEVASVLKSQRASLLDLQSALRGQEERVQRAQDQFMELRTQVLGTADTHLGAKARHGLWFNEPVTLEYDSAGQPSWSSTTERIIERAWVLRHLSDVPPGAKILDVGCSESTLGLELASNGFEVVGIDIRNHPLTHPSFKFIQQDICDNKMPDNMFDAAIALSTIEHIGLGAYGDAKAEGLHRVAMKEIYRILKPGGVLLLTTPFGKPAITPLHRIFDSNSLRVLLEGFDIRLLEFGIKVDKRTWISRVNESRADRDLDSNLAPGAVALVKAYKPK